MHIEKIVIENRQPHHAGLQSRYPIDHADWIWHPALSDHEPAFLCFRLSFEVKTGDPELEIHFSCDQYAELSIDGRLFARGPEASGIESYSFSSFRLKNLSPGTHQLKVFAWWLGTEKSAAPLARETLGPGFILGAAGGFSERMNTGSGPWEVAHLSSHRIDTARMYEPSFGIGGGLHLDTRKSSFSSPDYHPARISEPAMEVNRWGNASRRYSLRPASLPEQHLRPCTPGRVCAVVDDFIKSNLQEGSLTPFSSADLQHPDIPVWQSLWHSKTPLEIPPNQCVSVLIDLEEYFCAYPEITFSGGADSELTWEWAEALRLLDPETTNNNLLPGYQKGNRNELIGKGFLGISDTFFCNGDALSVLRPHWWRSGRYCLLRVRTAHSPLILNGLQILETRYPLEVTGSFTSDQDATLDPIKQLCLRGLEMCMHETYIDCPHYEQLMYVFDTRLQILCTFALSSDTRLAKRAIELFDLSRRRFGGPTCSRFPTSANQFIPLFSLCWTWMIRDYLYWQGEPEWLRRFIPGARAVHDWFEQFENSGGFLEALPGRMFGDCSPDWPCGALPGAETGVSAVFNLIYVHSLKSMADLEQQIGDPLRVPALMQKAERIQQQLRKKFWDAERGVFLDDARGALSQHAQIWAILSGTLTGMEATNALNLSLEDPAFAKVSYMQSSHLFDALVATGQGGRILTELSPWSKMVAIGARTGFEREDPSRSDCHGWSSHPLYHFQASLMGIQPAAPEFSKVRIAPQPGSLTRATAILPHPQGEITVNLSINNTLCEAAIKLPGTCTGIFHWQGTDYPLSSGLSTIQA